jgi:DNA-binding transcriptional MerR regulator
MGKATAEFSTLQVAREIGVHRATLLRWLQAGKIPEPRHIRAAGQDIRVWSQHDVERARRLKVRT